ncbi:MAG: UDP-N-acetylmuramoyl-L-alanine--D-glutamate ligase [Odoribacteraceae bacterium]|jgi:UDP-N-acetylmuramoylalanine--D-glutamate ligase|nr:UDP-N-acetylmuramoyl-L-alanine--D-glutamate ligase [Odoribacteraceae bacterium]
MMKLVILGGGESGIGAARLGSRLGHAVFLSDSGPLTGGARHALEEMQVEFEEGGHDARRVMQADLVVKSPGIPDTLPLVVSLRAAGVEVISEIEFAGRHTDAAMYCITGSNGKTTTTLLLYHLLRRGGLDVGLAGNVGHSLAARVATDPHAAYVVELSSFQLDGMSRFHCDTAILTNITPDHLDRYGGRFERYVDSKFRVLQNARPRDLFIYGTDCDAVRERVSRTRIVPRAARFTCHDDPGQDAWMSGDRLLARHEGRLFSIDRREISIQGRHNMYNAQAAVLAAMKAGVGDDDLRRGLATFPPVEHRLERVAVVNGVTYINDSKATNVDSALYALESVPPPVIWIAGGTDKGNDYAALKALAREKVKLLVCMGVDNARLSREFSGTTEVVDTRGLDEAMAVVAARVVPGDTVLLSPCCASFDLFRNYEDRGRQFKEKVMNLTRQDNGRDH